jgi:DNA-3-methyladenine glycosylase
LGHIVISTIGGQRVSGRIVETEAYVGPHDPACHAFGGRRTERTRCLYGPPGIAYVYFTYGMHWCLNAVTCREGYPAAVLIRALEPLDGLPVMRRRRGDVPDTELCAGPARLCEALGITGKWNGVPLQRGPLRIVRSGGGGAGKIRVVRTPRIGVTAARDWPLRYVVAQTRWASRPSRRLSVAR